MGPDRVGNWQNADVYARTPLSPALSSPVPLQTTCRPGPWLTKTESPTRGRNLKRGLIFH